MTKLAALLLTSNPRGAIGGCAFSHSPILNGHALTRRVTAWMGKAGARRWASAGGVRLRLQPRLCRERVRAAPYALSVKAEPLARSLREP